MIIVTLDDYCIVCVTTVVHKIMIVAPLEAKDTDFYSGPIVNLLTN